jgi:anaerobic magnesium-protoporphyrin IX monomethyl ester cyclase
MQIILATPAPISHRTAEENLGIGYLAAVLRSNGYTVGIVDGWLEGMTPEMIADKCLDANPLWLGFACYRSNIHQTMRSIEIIKGQSQMPIIVGGYGPTFYPEEFLNSGADIVVRGEAEETVVSITEHILNGIPMLSEIPGIAYIHAGKIVMNAPARLIPDLDKLPEPARDTLPLALKRKSAIHVVSSRGCAARCHFCSIVTFMRMSTGSQWRERSITSLVDEVERLSVQGVEVFKIVDDSFIEYPRDETWAMRLADELESRNLNPKPRFRASIRADRVNWELMRQLKRAGFFSFSCGIESFSASALSRMHKSASVENNEQALRIFLHFDMIVQAGHILFDPDTTMSELEENYQGMRKYFWVVSKGVFTEMFAAQDTPFTRMLKHRGELQLKMEGPERYYYDIKDPNTRLVYGMLKRWHKAHMAIYDKAIDPLSAPKAISIAAQSAFYEVYTLLRRQDLEIFGQILELAKAGTDETEASNFIQDRIESTSHQYEALSQSVDLLYQQFGFVYDANENPFIS